MKSILLTNIKERINLYHAKWVVTRNLQRKIIQMKNNEKIAKYLRNIARYVLLIFGILVFIFALLSGSEDYGGRLHGIIKNSPNALPWLLLLILIFVAWKWELVGGILITLLGVFLLFFFVICGNNFFLSTLIITLIPIIFGCFFILSWYLTKNKLS